MWDTITHPQHKSKVMFYYEVLNSLDYKGSMTSLQSTQSGFSSISKASGQHSTSGVSSCISGNLSETTTRIGDLESWHGMGLIKKRLLPPPVSLVHIDNPLFMPWQYSDFLLIIMMRDCSPLSGEGLLTSFWWDCYTFPGDSCGTARLLETDLELLATWRLVWDCQPSGDGCGTDRLLLWILGYFHV